MMRMRSCLLILLSILAAGCTHLDPPGAGRDTQVACGRLRFVANGEEVKWGAIFDRPTPTLFQIETERFINRIELAGDGLFTEVIDRDGTFCWRLGPGSYFISSIFPFQDDSPYSSADPGKFVFPGVAFQIDNSAHAVYLGTLKIAVSVRSDFMRNRRMTTRPSIEVLDEFDTDRTIAKERHGVALEKKLMVRVPELEGVPFNQSSRIEVPALLRAVPWFLVVPHR